LIFLRDRSVTPMRNQATDARVALPATGENRPYAEL
jgi:hypothetical protein